MNDVNELVKYLVTPTAQIAIIMALAEVFKRVGFDKKYIPIIDLVLGIAFGFLVYPQFGWVKALMIGLFLGLSACGVFSSIKNIYQGFKTVEDEKEDK